MTAAKPPGPREAAPTTAAGLPPSGLRTAGTTGPPTTARTCPADPTPGGNAEIAARPGKTAQNPAAGDPTDPAGDESSDPAGGGPTDVASPTARADLPGTARPGAVGVTDPPAAARADLTGFTHGGDAGSATRPGTAESRDPAGDGSAGLAATTRAGPADALGRGNAAVAVRPAKAGSGAPARDGFADPAGGDLARRATADPLFRLVAYALEAAHSRPPAAVWSAPYAFHLGSPGLVAAAGWPTAAAATPRTDGLVRLSSLGHPADSCDLPLTLSGRPPAAPDWATRPYAVLRALARAGYGRGGTDLHVQGSLTGAAGLATAEPAECAVALAVADVHTPAGEQPDREHLARLLAEALPDGDEGLRRAVFFARPGRALLLSPEPRRRQRYVAFDPAASQARLVLLAVRGEAADRPGELARAVACARRAGALSAWPPGRRPGRSVLVLLPEARMSAVRAAVTEDFRDRGRPVPRFLNIAVAGAARREE